jgi:fibronectin type 3 domain-containing protein
MILNTIMARLKITLIVVVGIVIAALIFIWSPPRIALSHPSHSVTLTWNASAGAKFYYVYRSTVSGSQYQKIGSTPTNTYQDPVVPNNTVLYYVITAVNENGESGHSKEIKVAVPQ